jgi:hypothetical protein
VPLTDLLYNPFYQLTRLVLLADKMVRTAEFGVSEATVILVRPEGNRLLREKITSPPLRARFPMMASVEDVFAATLKSSAQFTSLSPQTLLKAVNRVSTDQAIIDSAKYLTDRYGW